MKHIRFAAAALAIAAFASLAMPGWAQSGTEQQIFKSLTLRHGHIDLPTGSPVSICRRGMPISTGTTRKLS